MLFQRYSRYAKDVTVVVCGVCPSEDGPLYVFMQAQLFLPEIRQMNQDISDRHHSNKSILRIFVNFAEIV